MWNYEAVATRACDGIERPFALLGWSMGGLVAMLAARRVEPDALVLLEPSPPGESADGEAPEEGLYDPEEAYGPFPDGMRARPESRYARTERERGIPVASVPARTLVVSGDEFAEGGTAVARYGAESSRRRPRPLGLVSTACRTRSRSGSPLREDARGTPSCGDVAFATPSGYRYDLGPKLPTRGAGARAEASRGSSVRCGASRPQLKRSTA